MVIDLSTGAPALIALGSAVSLAVVNSWITTRAGIDLELRTERLKVYPPLWQATSSVSRWPRQQVSRGSLRQLHRSLRTWYFSTGGMYLSTRARDRYGDVQELVEALLRQEGAATEVLVDGRYVDLMATASSLRTALTEDLDTRRRPTLVERGRRLRWHRRAGRKAKARMLKVKQSEPVFQPGLALESPTKENP